MTRAPVDLCASDVDHIRIATGCHRKRRQERDLSCLIFYLLLLLLFFSPNCNQVFPIRQVLKKKDTPERLPHRMSSSCIVSIAASVTNGIIARASAGKV
jgi:hypothetical protein